MSTETGEIHSLKAPGVEVITPLTAPDSNVESVEIIKSGHSDAVFLSIESKAIRAEENGISLQSDLKLNESNWELLKNESLRQHMFDSFEKFCEEHFIKLSDLAHDEKTGKVTLVLIDSDNVSSEVIFEPKLNYTYVQPSISVHTIFDQKMVSHGTKNESPLASHYRIFLGVRDLMYDEEKFWIMQRYKREISQQKEKINFPTVAKQISLLADRGFVNLTLEQLTELSRSFPKLKDLLEQVDIKKDITDLKDLYLNMKALIKFTKSSRTDSVGNVVFTDSDSENPEAEATSELVTIKLNCLSLMEDPELLQTILTYEIEWRQLISQAEEKDMIRNPSDFIISVFNMVRAHHPEKQHVIDAIIQAYDTLLQKGSPILSPGEDQIVTPLKFLTNAELLSSEEVANTLAQEVSYRSDANKSAMDLQNTINGLQQWAVHRRKTYQDGKNDEYDRYEAYAHVARALTAGVNLITLSKYYKASGILESLDW